MKKVLFVLESLSGGGAEKILVDLVKNLDHSKYDITVLLISETGVYVEEAKSVCKIKSILPDYVAIRNRIGKLLYKIWYKLIYSMPIKIVAALYIKERFDIEVAFVEGYATKLVAASKKRNKKIAWVHTDFEQNHWTTSIYKGISEERKTYDKFAKILCVSQTVQESFQKVIGIKENVDVQYNPLDADEIRLKAQESLVLPHNIFRFITVGRLVEQKGYDRLLEVSYRLKQEGYTFEVFILGEGVERECLENKIDKYDLKNYIQLLGFKKNPYKYMSESDMFLCTSRSEGYSTVATEALIVGIPILTTDCSGMRELFGKYNCGIITTNSEEGIYESMKAVLSNSKILKKFECDIQKRAWEFDIQKRILEIEEIFNEKNIDYEQ